MGLTKEERLKAIQQGIDMFNKFPAVHHAIEEFKKKPSLEKAQEVVRQAELTKDEALNESVKITFGVYIEKVKTFSKEDYERILENVRKTSDM